MNKSEFFKKCVYFPFIYPIQKLVSLCIFFYFSYKNKKICYARTDRLGEFAVQMGLFFGQSADVCWMFSKPYFNNYIIEKTIKSKKVKLWPFSKTIFDQVFKIAKKKKSPILFSFNNRDIKNKSKTPPFLQFSKEELNDGLEFLRKIGVQQNQSFVCLYVRDKKYLSEHESPQNEINQKYRNSSIKNYVDLCKFINSQNIFIIRVGSNPEKIMPYKNKLFFDYSASNLRSEFFDCFLGANCLFSVATGSGWDSLPFLAKKPIIFTNLFPFFYFPSYVPRSITLPKLYFDLKTKQYLNINSLKKDSIGYLMSYHDLKKKRIKVFENSRKDLLEASKEMIRKIKNKSFDDKFTKYYQKEFWNTFPKNELDPKTGQKLHGNIRSRISDSFLKSNLWLIDK